MSLVLITAVSKLILQRFEQVAEALVVGINGAQGSGKSTFSRHLKESLQQQHNKKVVVLSLDDLYKTQAERQELVRDIHPLFATRGVPGTHDVQLGIDFLTALKNSNDNSQVLLPIFDKALDDCLPRDKWRVINGKIDIVIFEGWCVGAESQPENELIEPVNNLEKLEDPHGVWRRYANDVLANEYQQLFELLDLLVMLEVPSFDLVYQHRLQQEKDLGAQVLQSKDSVSREPMTDSEVQRFIMHYQRLTEHMLRTMPAQADLVLSVDEQHNYLCRDAQPGRLES